MSFRDEQKAQREKFSRILIQGALELSAREGYASLSLRSVARKAGIAPTSFYRHFRDMDELGVAMADMAAGVLAGALSEALARTGTPPEKAQSGSERAGALEAALKPFLETLYNRLLEHRDLMWFFFQERTGSSLALRAAIGRAHANAVRRLGEEFSAKGLKEAAKPQVAGALFTLAVKEGMDFLSEDREDTGIALAPVLERVAFQCALVLLGAASV
jgi:AcrR family transcriptional regulator